MKSRHYSPQIRRDLVSKLYHRAKAERVPMTKLTNRLLDEAMTHIESVRIAEQPAPPSVA